MGDLLLSGPEDPGAGPLKLPTVDDIREVYPEDYEWHRPIALKQKIAIISDRPAVGWAGREIILSRAGRTCREAFRFPSSP